jgi:pilus assembly protein CpaB
MKAKTLVPLIIGLAVGFVAIKMGVDMVQKAKGAQGPDRPVLVAAKPIEIATRITPNMLTTKSVPGASAPAGSFVDQKLLVGRVTGMRIAAGVPITASMLAPPGSEPGLRAIIPPGYRAVSVSVTEESAVAGFVVPGSRVDVFAVSPIGEGKVILTDVEVGAVGQSLSEVGADGKTTHMSKSVTLFLRPEQVQILHANSVGKHKLRLAMRGNSNDPGDNFWSRLFQKSAQPKAEPTTVHETAVPREHVVMLRRGNELERYVFEESGDVLTFKGDAASLGHGARTPGARLNHNPAARENLE